MLNKKKKEEKKSTKDWLYSPVTCLFTFYCFLCSINPRWCDENQKKKNQNAHFIGEFCFYENYKNSRKAVKVKPGEEKRKRGNVRTQRERKAKHQREKEQDGKMERKKKKEFWQKARHYIEKKKKNHGKDR